MIDKFETKVYWQDTDAYGVVWHGNYLRWFEKARTQFCEKLGYKLEEYEARGIVSPVVGINIKYKKSAKLHEKITIETKLIAVKRFMMSFEQVVKNGDEIYTIAQIDVVFVDVNTGKMLRKLPMENVEQYIES